MDNYTAKKEKNTGLSTGQHTESGFMKFGQFLNRRAGIIACIALLAVMLTGTVFATPPTSTADTLWQTVSDLIGTWVTRLGAVVMFVGAVMFGLGWKNDDAEGKSRGISTLISGAIVTAVAAMVGIFFA